MLLEFEPLRETFTPLSLHTLSLLVLFCLLPLEFQITCISVHVVHRECTIDANLTGSKIDAQCYNIPLFDSPFTSILGSIPNLLIQTKIFQISCNQQGEFLVPVLYMKVKMSAPLVFVPASLHLNDTYVILYLLFQRFFLTYPSFS